MRLLIGRHFKWILFFLGIAILLFAGPGPAYCQSEDQIVRWVAAEMSITKAYPMPLMRFVNKSELGQIFAARSKQCMARWTADHGPSTADKIMGVYMDKAVGLFDPKSGVVYVGSFLPDCQRDAVLAHEITHYFQYVFGGAISEEGFAAEMMLMEREIEASTIERRFEKQFCGGPALAQRP